MRERTLEEARCNVRGGGVPAGRSSETRNPPTRAPAPLLHGATAVDLLLLRSPQGLANFPPHVVWGADSKSPHPFSVRFALNGNFGPTPAEVPTAAVCRLSYSFQSLPLSFPPPSAPPSLPPALVFLPHAVRPPWKGGSQRGSMEQRGPDSRGVVSNRSFSHV